MAKLEVMDQTGHTTLEYALDEEAALANAKAAFDEAVVGHIAYAVDDESGDVTVLEHFDETAEHIVMADAMVGG